MKEIRTKKDHGVARLTIARPEKRNAFGETTIQEIRSVLKELSNDASIRVLVLEGEGRAFSAGADLTWMKSMVDYSLKENMKDAKLLHDMLEQLYDFPKPTIAKVHGAAFGGAVGLIAACDIGVVANGTKLALSETRLGIIPAVISPFLLRKVGVGYLRAYGLSAKLFSAEEALRMGLIHEVVEEGKLEDAVGSWVELLLETGPDAVTNLKKLIREIENASIHDSMTSTVKAIAEARTSTEGQEGMKAFLEKRKPDWATEGTS